LPTVVLGNAGETEESNRPMNENAQEQIARRRKRRRRLFVLKLVVFVLIFANIGFLGWYVWKHPFEWHVGGTRRYLAAKPGKLDFGQAQPGTPVAKTITIRNRTRDEVEIQLIDFTDASFRVEPDERNIALPPRGRVELTVIYAASVGGVSKGEMHLRVRGQSSPDLIVPLQGETLLPRLALSTQLLDFGEVKTRAGARLRLGIRNGGTMPLTVSAVAVRGDGFGLTRPFAPVGVEPGETLTVEVAFVPAKIGPSEGALVVQSNDPNQSEITVALAGSFGAAAKAQRERAQALALLNDAKRDLGIAYAYLSFTSTNKLLERERHRMGQETLDKAWPKYERANETLRSIDPALEDKEYYLEGSVLKRRTPGAN
jgi:hypothetical protein